MEKAAICFCNTYKNWGGGEKWHYTYALQFKEKGYPVHAVAHRGSELAIRLKKAGIPVKETKLTNLSFLNLYKILMIRGYFRKNKISAVFMALPIDMKVCGLAASWAGVRKIIYRRGLAVPVKNSFTNRYLFKNVLTDVIANSIETRNMLLKNNKDLIPGGKLHLIYNGIDCKAYHECKASKIRTNKNGTVVLGNAGRLVEQKGQKYLLEIAQILQDKKIEFKLLIAGRGKLEKELKYFTEKHHLEDKVDFLGFVENIKSFMESIDIFALTSLWEGFGNVLAEAMLSEKPVVAFNLSSNSELVKDGHNGYLIQNMDMYAFAGKIEELIKDPGKRKEMGKNGREYIEKHFDISLTLKQLETLIQ